ncbi:MAG: Mut7-C RNAse domain-containing protein [Elainellaceae cyanobacterium]
MVELSIRFYGDLNDFLPIARQQVRFAHTLRESASVKDVIESLGVPHPEVALILLDGKSIGFSYLVQQGDRLSVYPRFRSVDISTVSQVQPDPLPDIRFVADVHLGKLAMHLRLLGFDVLYENNYDDDTLALLAGDRRILLTQDRALLKRSVITHGYCVRSSDPVQQLDEILRRFDLYGAIAPFKRCLRCNGILKPVNKQDIHDRLEPLTRKYYDEFRMCQQCEHIYWKGSHYERMQQFISDVLPA